MTRNGKLITYGFDSSNNRTSKVTSTGTTLTVSLNGGSGSPVYSGWTCFEYVMWADFTITTANGVGPYGLEWIGLPHYNESIIEDVAFNATSGLEGSIIGVTDSSSLYVAVIAKVTDLLTGQVAYSNDLIMSGGC